MMLSHDLANLPRNMRVLTVQTARGPIRISPIRVGNVPQLQVMKMTVRGYFRAEAHFPASTQQAILTKAGVTAAFEDFDDMLHMLRKGDAVAVAGFRAFVTNHHDIADAIDAIHAKGAQAIDAATGRTSHRDGVRLLSEAIIALANERRGGHAKARQHGKKGAVASAAARRAGWMPWGEIRKFWFDKRLTRAEVMVAVTAKPFKPISYNTIHRKLGARDANTGRPPKQ